MVEQQKLFGGAPKGTNDRPLPAVQLGGVIIAIMLQEFLSSLSPKGKFEGKKNV